MKLWYMLQYGWTLKSIILSEVGAEYIMRNARLDEAQTGINIAGKNINKLRYADDTTHMAENEGKLEPLDESERGEWKSCLKTQHSMK